jgi:L1 cell adhesion molecule like protein
MSRAIGIDLGTTFSCVAAWDQNRAEVIANHQSGKLTTPSKVAFTDKQILVGVPADNHSIHDPDNVVFCSKRLIGKKFDDAELQKDLPTWPFKVIAGKDGNPVFQVTHETNVKTYSPEEISSHILTKMREIATTKFGEEIRDAVITVPAYFTYSQRQATVNAGAIAGLNVLRVINEPTAAALAYGFHLEATQPQTIVVYDFGGGTFDVSILKIHKSKFQVLATDGNAHLGGEDLDNVFVDVIAKDILKKNKVDVMQDKRMLGKVRRACVDVKEILSEAMETKYIVDLGKFVYQRSITTAWLGQRIDPLVDVTLDIVKEVMDKAKVTAEQVTSVLLVGGSSKLPKVKQRMGEMFGEGKLKHTVHADHAVAQGAAILAAILTDKLVTSDIMEVKDVTPLTLGVESDGGQFKPIIPRNTPIPCDRTVVFTTRTDFQTRITFPIIEGERGLAKFCHQLGVLEINGIPPHEVGKERVKLTLKLDANGILSVEACSMSTNIRNQISLQAVGHLTQEQVDRLVEESKKNKAQDNIEQKRIECKNAVQTYVGDILRKCRKGEIDPTKKAHVEEVAGELSDWMDEFPEASVAQMMHQKDILAQVVKDAFV